MSEATPLLKDRQPTADGEPSSYSRPSSPPGGGQHSPSPSSSRPPRSLREVALFVWALLATAAFVVLAVYTQHHSALGGGDDGRDGRDGTILHPPSHQAGPVVPSGKRNLIFMVSDGMGPASLSLTRSFRQHVEKLPVNDTLVLDRHFWGTSRTRSSSSLVTDSAAGATAFSCGKKSYNGAISVTPDYEPCGTVLEAAKRAGYHTGLVVTTDITDATPGCFASHALLRAMEDSIALQEVGEGPLGRVVDLMFGGGRCRFLPNSTEGSCRADDVDVVSIARNTHGWTYASDRAGFDAYDKGEAVTLPALGLFAPSDIPFEIDRRNMAGTYPSLSEMAATALRALEKATEHTEQGFFLMIEGSRIDHAGHYNDPAAQVREVLEYDKTFGLVADFLERSSTEGVLVATSDHETGGLATALQEPGHLPKYQWYPHALERAGASAELLAAKLRSHMAGEGASENHGELRVWIDETLVRPHLGIQNAREEELQLLVDFPERAISLFSAMISLRAHVGWSTHGHSAVDVNIYSSGGPVVDALRGNVENTDVGEFLAWYLDLDVHAVTKELRASKANNIQGFSRGEESPEEIVEAYLEKHEGGRPRWASMSG